MAQKTKVKELVGRGLNSYHTKALQQMDRIEKKNKEQNHKISILSNELDNDYLTKTEEGSVISLEHSKEGMVYLDELQGNTLVNYCTDGSKEMTLNGDIDVEGTFVTTTEGVDNGKIDVMCEGNTLVNLWDDEKSFTIIRDYPNHNLSVKSIKPNTTYTLILRCDVNVDGAINLKDANNNYSNLTSVGNVSNLNTPIKFTTLNEGDFSNVKFRLYSATQSVNVYSALLLEGDWTNKEIPQYFEGMKSVGQDNENGHKIEILSNNSLIQPKYFKENYYVSHLNQSIFVLKFIGKPNTSYTMSTNHTKTTNNYDFFFDLDNKASSASNGVQNGEPRTVTTSTDGIMYIMLRNTVYNGFLNGTYHIYLQETSKSTSYKLNKKEILINEPLRGLPNGVKDRFVKIGGKWFIERNVGCKDLVVTGGTNWGTQVAEGMIGFHDILDMGTNYNGTVVFEVAENIVCDKLPSIRMNQLLETTYDAIIRGSNYVGITVKADKLETQDLDGFKKYINSLNAKFIYNLATPIYEPLEIEPTLNTYNDVTHISNNSIIPCTMKIQNSGYNAIIKPSTQYTVALDTNKGETVGMNLGGAKVTTTNNVATITTPATLTDDSLRLYGKGIKGSKVRLLEGDKTNWIPSFFEGMKSSFEDKVQEDGSYKMEILSNNKNLLNLDKLLNAENYLKGTYSSIKIPLKPNTTYYFKFDFKSNNIHRWIGIFSEPLGYYGTFKKGLAWNDNIDKIIQGTFITDNSTEYYLSVYQPSVSYNDNNWYKELFTNVYEDFIISQVDDNYMEGKSNKIQFSSIEPLRGVGDVKDKFVFKDGKLIIERNCGEVTLNGSEDEHWTYHSLEPSNKYSYRTNCFSSKSKPQTSVKCNNFVSGNPSSAWKHRYNNIAILNTNNCHIYCDIKTLDGFKQWLQQNPTNAVYQLAEPTYEEIPFELQKIILEGYENGTLFIDTNIPPTSTVTYAGETPIVKATKLNKTEVLNNTEDINDNIIPYLMDMDYRVVMLQLATEELEDGVSMARLFGGTYEMIKRDILSKRLTREEYGYRLADYYNAGKLTEEQVRELEDLR